jgi:hypothetical protein
MSEEEYMVFGALIEFFKIFMSSNEARYTQLPTLLCLIDIFLESFF